MAKTVVYSSSTRLICACATEPEVILCLASSELVAPRTCVDEETPMPFDFTTIEATLTQAYRNLDSCGNAKWLYVFSYNPNDLADPAYALTATDIAGVFCQDCITDWVQQVAGNEVTMVDNGDGTITFTSQHGCTFTFSGISS